MNRLFSATSFVRPAFTQFIPSAQHIAFRFVSRKAGTVKWFDEKKGFGFITPDDQSKDLFVHFSAIKSRDQFRTLPEGGRVSFNVEESPRGPQATEVALEQAQ
eukprot:c7171_g1_i1.p1 GENE.c7171_g1_i1~~c7171_g1_i1.p1  ORF type:complete len:103 (-),score=21.41 c7171_g1_i1:113-421(-)